MKIIDLKRSTFPGGLDKVSLQLDRNATFISLFIRIEMATLSLNTLIMHLQGGRLYE